MQYLNNVKPKIIPTIKSVVAMGVDYVIRLQTGDWSPFFGQYEGQKHDDLDSNCCWAYAENEKLEDNLEYNWKNGLFSKETMKWFDDNGYIDSDGDFYLSRRFIPILSGVKRNGNDPANFWSLTVGTTFTNGYGAIPNKLLPYTNNEEYFDKSKITPEMYALGREFLKRVNIEVQEVGSRWIKKDMTLLKGELFRGELSACIPVPHDGSWNQVRVNYPGVVKAEHDVALYRIDEIADYNYPYFIYDQYEPHLKQLSRDYEFPIVIQTIVTPKVQVIPNPVSQLTLGAKIWIAIMEWYRNNFH